MRVISIGIYALCIWALISCSQKEQQDKKDVTDYLSGITLHSNELVGSTIICIKGDMLIMNSFDRDSVAVIYTMKGDTLEYVKHIGIKGRGPFEFEQPFFSSTEDSLYMLNTTLFGDLQNIYITSTDNIGQIDNYSFWKDYKLDWTESLKKGPCFIPFEDKLFLIIGGKLGEENILSIIDASTKEIIPMSYWIEDDYSGPVIPKQSIYMSNSRIFKNGNKLLFACGEGRYLEIMDIKDGKIAGRAPIYCIKPEYEASPDGLNFRIKYDNYRGMQVRTTKDYIYVSLRVWTPEMEPYKGYPFYFFDEVEVYDWSGNFIKCYQTDTPFYDFAVTDDNNTLFTVTQDPESKEHFIHKYGLDM